MEHVERELQLHFKLSTSRLILFEVLEVSLAMLLRKMSDILNASRIRPKENPPLAFLASTGGRLANSNKGNDRATS